MGDEYIHTYGTYVPLRLGLGDSSSYHDVFAGYMMLVGFFLVYTLNVNNLGRYPVASRAIISVAYLH